MLDVVGKPHEEYDEQSGRPRTDRDRGDKATVISVCDVIRRCRAAIMTLRKIG
jgi:hypothetical protein